MGSFPLLLTEVGPDGLMTESPMIAYTEKVLEEKEQKLKRYIEDNYSKIRNVEKELAGLTLEVKLTAGPKKAALEHLRKKIELSTEKIKAAKLKEEQAKKAWKLAEKQVEAEENYKQSLCEDLNRLVQESAAAQYSRLEDLTRRLEALNPELKGSVNQILAEGTAANSSILVESEVEEQPVKAVIDVEAHPGPQSSVSSGSSGKETKFAGRGQHVSIGKGRGRNVGGTFRSPLVLHGPKSTNGSNWTGAGFDVGDNS